MRRDALSFSERFPTNKTAHNGDSSSLILFLLLLLLCCSSLSKTIITLSNYYYLSRYSTDSIIISEQFWIFAPTSYTLHTRLQRYKSQQMWAKKFTAPFQQLLILWFSSKLPNHQSIFGFADSREMEMQYSVLSKSRLGAKCSFFSWSDLFSLCHKRAGIIGNPEICKWLDLSKSEINGRLQVVVFPSIHL